MGASIPFAWAPTPRQKWCSPKPGLKARMPLTHRACVLLLQRPQKVNTSAAPTLLAVTCIVAIVASAGAAIEFELVKTTSSESKRRRLRWQRLEYVGAKAGDEGSERPSAR